MLGRFRKVFSKLQGLEAEAPAEPDPSSPPDPPVLDFRTFGEVLTFRTCCLLPVHEEFEAPAGPDHVLVLNPRTRRVLAEDPLEVEYTADVCGSDGPWSGFAPVAASRWWREAGMRSGAR